METRSRTPPLREPDAERPQPPANVEAEQALLGAILINNAAYSRVAEFLLPEHFANGAHGRIYAAAGTLIERGQIANPVTLKNLFDQDGALLEVGGAQYLGGLAEAAVTIINAEHYGRSIRDLYLRRELITIGQDLVSAAYTIDIDKSPQEIVDEHETALAAAVGSGIEIGGGGDRSMAAAVRASLARTEAAYKTQGEAVGVETGLVDLDRLLGGLLPGNLEVLAGRPSMGKTSCAAGIAMHAADHDLPSCLFSLEETAEQQAQRIIAMESGVPTDRQRRGDVDMVHWRSLVDAEHRLGRLPIYIDDTPGQTVSQLRRRIRDMVRRRGIRLAIVDHLQLVRPAGRQSENRNVELGEITRTLKETAKNLSIPILLLSQLSRAVEARDNKKPLLSDLRESGSIEQDADRVIFVYRHEYYISRTEPERRPEETQERFNDRHQRWVEAVEASAGVAELILAKNRFGPTGTVRVHWNAELTRFSNLARHER